ncbi:MAG: hypothetical protein AAB428_00740 [Patescibacteria group bacterium]
MSEATERPFKKGQLVMPKEGHLEHFRREDYVREMLVSLVFGDTTDAVWLELVNNDGNLIVGPTGNIFFSDEWVERSDGDVFEKGQQVVPAPGYLHEFQNKDRNCPMFVQDVTKETSKLVTSWLRLVDDKGREIINPGGSKLFSPHHVRRKNS